MTDSIPRVYKPWIIVCTVVLVGSFLLLAVAVTAGIMETGSDVTPLWVVISGGLALLGIVVGFGGLFGILFVAGWKAWREGRRVQIISPDHLPHASYMA